VSAQTNNVNTGIAERRLFDVGFFCPTSAARTRRALRQRTGFGSGHHHFAESRPNNEPPRRADGWMMGSAAASAA
jgi:hypothetical protein